MTRELTHQLERLSQERQRLENLLARRPAWLGLQQLAAETEPAPDTYERYVHDRRKSQYEAELAGDPVFGAHRSLMAAIRVIEQLLAERSGTAAGQPLHDVSEVAAGFEDPAPGQQVANQPAAWSPAEALRQADIELISLSGARDGQYVTRTAKIHKAVPGPEATKPGDSDRPADDLTRIRRIDKGLAAALMARGIRRYGQIAAFAASDVRALSAALDLGSRISRENWIEQAALLAMKAGAGADVGMPAAPPADLPGSPAALPRTDQAVTAAATAIAAALANRHVGEAVTGQRETPTPGPHDAAVLDPAAHHSEPIAAFDALLAASGLDSAIFTDEIVRDAALRIAASARMRQPQPAAEPSPVVAAQAGPDAPPDPAPLPASEPQAQPEQEAPSAEPDQPDDLTRIRGIDEELRERLAARGVTRFAQIAAWDAPTVNTFKALLGGLAEISCDGWIEQAAILGRGGSTAHARRIDRCEHHALATWPEDTVERDPEFSAWLMAQSLALAASAPRTDDGTLDDAPTNTIDAEPVNAPLPTAQIIPLRRVIDIDADASALHIPAQRNQEIGALADAKTAHADDEEVEEEQAEAPAHAPLPGSEVDSASPPEPDQSEPRPLARSLTIADRITAIERESATLPVPPRMVLTRFRDQTPATATPTPELEARAPSAPGPAPIPDPAAAADAVITPSGDETFDKAGIDPQADVGEADVRIVKRPTVAGDPGTQDPRAPSNAADAAVSPAGRFDRQDYAAYRDTVEEASVEILAPQPDGEVERASSSSGSGPAAAAQPRQQAEATCKVRRFLKALTGN